MIPPTRPAPTGSGPGSSPRWPPDSTDDEELHLLVSPKSRPMHQGYGDRRPTTSPFPGRTRARRSAPLTEHLYAPVRLPLVEDRRFSTLMAPIVRSGARAWSSTSRPLHAYTAPAGDPARRSALSADELPAHGQGRGRDHHQLGEPAARGHALSRRRPRQAAAHPRGRGPRAVPSRGSRRGLAARQRRATVSPAVRALRVVAVALQELRGAAARLRGREVRARRPSARRRRPRSGRRVRRRAPGAGRAVGHRRRRRVGRRRPARGDGPLLPSARTSSCIRPSTRRSACPSWRPWRRVPRRHLGHQRDAGDRRRLRSARGPARTPSPSPTPSSRPAARRGSGCGRGPGAGGRVHLGATAERTLACTARSMQRRGARGGRR